MLLPYPSTPLVEITDPRFQRAGVSLYLKRDDLLHPVVSGNKWYKLKRNLEQAKADGYKRLLSFGGAYSNHLHALAYAGEAGGFDTIGVIRGELPQPLNPTLQDAADRGMRFYPVTRSDYRRKTDPLFLQDLCAELSDEFGSCFVIPEGGSNRNGALGCKDMLVDIDAQLHDYDYIAVPCGTGTTLAGLAAFSRAGRKVLGFSVVKNDASMEPRITDLIKSLEVGNRTNWHLINDFHFGGFAKLNAELAGFMDDFLSNTGITLEPIYTGKMLYGLFRLVQDGYFPSGSRIVAIHTGGLQGLSGFADKLYRYTGNKHWLTYKSPTDSAFQRR